MAGGRTPVRLLVLAVIAIACDHSGAVPPAAQPPGMPGPTTPGETATAPRGQAPRDGEQVGYATWYGARFSGRRTADGERFDPNKMTAAHRTLPFGTWVEVRRVDTGESVRVRITDRGPFGHDNRIIDLSRAAAQVLRITKEGVAMVRLRVVPGP